MIPQPPLRTRLLTLLEPSFILYGAISSYAQILLRHLLALDFSPLFHPHSIRDDAFSTFWSWLSDPAAAPVSEDQLIGSAMLVPPLLAQARGTVLEIGPGNGTATRWYAPARDAIAHIYAAEPARQLHAVLRRHAEQVGLAGKYTVLDAPADPGRLAEALCAPVHGLVKGGRKTGEPAEPSKLEAVFDTVVCVRVLCSVPRQDEVVAHLYRLLKPGGRMLVVEHVRNPWRTAKGSILARLMQSFYEMLGWSFFVGDCELTRRTQQALERVAERDGGWASVQVEPELSWAVISYIAGMYVKRG